MQIKSQKKHKKTKIITSGIICGFLNGFFGAGGGTVVVPMLRNIGLDEKKAHATSVAVILPVTVVSAVMYIIKGNIDIKQSIIFALFGIPGAVFGAYLLKKISAVWIKRIFGILIAAASVRMFFK